MPDYFVPLDTTQFTNFHRRLMAKGIVMDNDLKYMDNHRRQIQAKYPHFKEHLNHFTVPQQLVDSILSDGRKQKIEPRDKAELDRTLNYLRTQLKALIARDIWDTGEYFEVMNQQSDIVRKAVELVEK